MVVKINKEKINKFEKIQDIIEQSKLKERIIDDSKGMSARAAKATINKGLTSVSDDTILRLLKKQYK